MTEEYIVARIMFDVDSLKAHYPLRDIAIAVTWAVLEKIKAQITPPASTYFVPGDITLYGIPIEIIDGASERWYVALKGLMPKE